MAQTARELQVMAKAQDMTQSTHEASACARGAHHQFRTLDHLTAEGECRTIGHCVLF